MMTTTNYPRIIAPVYINKTPYDMIVAAKKLPPWHGAIDQSSLYAPAVWACMYNEYRSIQPYVKGSGLAMNYFGTEFYVNNLNKKMVIVMVITHILAAVEQGYLPILPNFDKTIKVERTIDLSGGEELAYTFSLLTVQPPKMSPSPPPGAGFATIASDEEMFGENIVFMPEVSERDALKSGVVVLNYMKGKSFPDVIKFLILLLTSMTGVTKAEQFDVLDFQTKFEILFEDYLKLFLFYSIIVFFLFTVATLLLDKLGKRYNRVDCYIAACSSVFSFLMLKLVVSTMGLQHPFDWATTSILLVLTEMLVVVFLSNTRLFNFDDTMLCARILTLSCLYFCELTDAESYIHRN